jgi:tetratricopeptide (TPR) repeat protein
MQGNGFEWGTPVLYLRSPDGQIFDVESVQTEGREQSRLAVLYNEAQLAFEAEDWAKAVENLQFIVGWDPGQREAAVKLAEAQKRQELFRLYSDGRMHYEAERLPQALEAFQQVYEQGGNYKDVLNLIAEIRKETDVNTNDIAQGMKPVESDDQMILPIARQRRTTTDRMWAIIGIAVAVTEAIVILVLVAASHGWNTHMTVSLRSTQDWLWLLSGTFVSGLAGYCGYLVVLPRQIALKRYPSNIRKLIVSIVLLVDIIWFNYVLSNAVISFTALFLFLLWLTLPLMLLLTRQRRS